jgi:hypothetical protein
MIKRAKRVAVLLIRRAAELPASEREGVSTGVVSKRASDSARWK